MKTKEELNEIKEEIEKLDKKLRELTEEELEQVTGGTKCIRGVVAEGGKFVAEDVAVVDNFVFANGGGAALPSVVIDTTYK